MQVTLVDEEVSLSNEVFRIHQLRLKTSEPREKSNKSYWKISCAWNTNKATIKYYEQIYQKRFEIAFFQNSGKSDWEIKLALGFSKSTPLTVCKRLFAKELQ